MPNRDSLTREKARSVYEYRLLISTKTGPGCGSLSGFMYP